VSDLEKLSYLLALMVIETLKIHVAPIRKVLGTIPGEPLNDNDTRIPTYKVEREDTPKMMLRSIKKPRLKYGP